MPILQGVLPIKGADIPAEVIAGITLGALAVPEVMGYTKIAGMPVITGLYTILIPMGLFGIFGSSRHLVVGADSATAAILAAGLVGLASTGSDEHLALAAVLALMAAGFLILVRIIGLGFMAEFLSRTVLIGFLTGVGIQVALGEISGMLGLPGGGHGTLAKIWDDLQKFEQVNFYALAITLSVLVVMVGSKKVSKKIPGALIAVIGAIVLSWALDLKAHVHILITLGAAIDPRTRCWCRPNQASGTPSRWQPGPKSWTTSKKRVDTRSARCSARRLTTTRWRMSSKRIDSEPVQRPEAVKNDCCIMPMRLKLPREGFVISSCDAEENGHE